VLQGDLVFSLPKKKPRPADDEHFLGWDPVPELLGTLRLPAIVSRFLINQATLEESVCLQLLIVNGVQKVRSVRKRQANSAVQASASF